MRIESVATTIVGYRYYDFVYYWNMTNSLLISGCVLYIVHAMLYAFVMCRKLFGRSISRSNSSTSSPYDNTLNTNAYQMIPLPLSTNKEGEELGIAEA
ncbi:predicted protein [Chaetoceros tenuissimus]|uniref:Uncharacterized protein n=1 Tax=Chaetoceros tenuissimus TaxID=426638 RepID=A0AAD3D5R4_9STRA|nr:predicted protein [Chaetoceros tenuissimus]